MLISLSAACGGAPQSKAAESAPPAQAAAASAGAAEAGDADVDDDDSNAADNLTNEQKKDGRDAFERAEAELDEVFGGRLKQPGKLSSEDEGEEISSLDAQNQCTVACKALGSMKRSADQVCEFVGEDHERCIDVRDRVARASALVYSKCPTCAVARP